MRFFKQLSLTPSLIFICALTFSHMPVAQTAESLSALNCQQLKTQLNAVTDKMKRSLGSGSGANNNSAVGDVIWGGLVGQQIKRSNGSVSSRVSQLKRAYSRKCSN